LGNKLYLNSKILDSYFYTRSPLFTGMDDLLLKGVDENKEAYLNEDIWKELIKPKDIKRHFIKKSSFRVFFPYEIVEGKFNLIEENKFKKNYPKTYEYLVKFKEDLLKRKDSGRTFKQINRPWYALMRVGTPQDYFRDKIITLAVIKKVSFCIDKSKRLFPTGGTYGLISKDNSNLDIKYIYSLLNSKLFEYLLFASSVPKRGGYIAISAEGLKSLPIKEISQKDQKPFIELVERILSITNNKDYLADLEKQAIVRAYEKRIDKLVYELYDLNSEEIKIVDEYNKVN